MALSIKNLGHLAGDQNRSNDTASGQVINYVQPINTFPFIEDFETGSYLTQNLGNNWFVFTNGVAPNFRWQVGKGAYPNTKTLVPPLDTIIKVSTYMLSQTQLLETLLPT